MKVHANAALGPASRLALLQAIELRGARHSPPLVAPLAFGG